MLTSPTAAHKRCSRLTFNKKDAMDTETTPTEPADSSIVTALRGQRRTAARHMVQAWTAPAFHVGVDIDLTEASRAKALSPGSTVTDVITRVCAQALADHPHMNAWFEGDASVRSFDAVNIGIAVAGPKGLIVPVIHDAGRLTLREVTDRRRNLVERARTGGLGLPDVSGGTFTISNLGMFGVAEFDAILNVPQVAILAVAAAEDRFVRSGEDAAWRPVARFTLTCDHRAIDGAAAARFLSHFKTLMEGSAE